MRRYKHDHCDDCVELGQFEVFDLYYCPQKRIGAPTLLARFGDEGRDYYNFNPTLAGPPPGDQEPWVSAYERALGRGLEFTKVKGQP